MSDRRSSNVPVCRLVIIPCPASIYDVTVMLEMETERDTSLPAGSLRLKPKRQRGHFTDNGQLSVGSTPWTGFSMETWGAGSSQEGQRGLSGEVKLELKLDNDMEESHVDERRLLVVKEGLALQGLEQLGFGAQRRAGLRLQKESQEPP